MNEEIKKKLTSFAYLKDEGKHLGSECVIDKDCIVFFDLIIDVDKEGRMAWFENVVVVDDDVYETKLSDFRVDF